MCSTVLTHLSLSLTRGGCSNQLFECESTTQPGYKAVIRFYGSDLTGEGNSHKPMSEEVEAQVMRRLSAMGLYPSILNVFPGGRIEEFAAGRPPTLDEINSLPVNLLLMKKLAAIHSMKDMPNAAEPGKAMFVFDTFHKYLADMETANQTRSPVEPGDREAYEFIRSVDLHQESAWLQQMFPSIASRIVFSHNDMYKNNILLVPDANNNLSDDNMLVIDYEYASSNYRWADLAIHITEMSFQSYDAERDQLIIPHADASFVQAILRCYLDEWRTLNKESVDEQLDTLPHLMHELEFGELIIYLARVLFFCGYVGRNYGPMQSWKYTRVRLQEYLRAKQQFLQKATVASS